MEWSVEYTAPDEDAPEDEDPSVVATVSWPFDAVAGWHGEIELRLVDGVVSVQRVSYVGDEPDALIGRTVLRALRLADVAKAIEDDLRDPRMRHALPVEWLTTYAALPHPGRRGRTPADAALWAQRYVDAVAEHPDAPVRFLIDTYGVSRSALNDTIRRAETLGYITGRPPKGQPGGRLTAKAKRLLDDEGK